MLHNLLWLAFAVAAQAQNVAQLSLNPADYNARDIIYRDVAVIGGGSSGTYTAVRLTDYNKTVVLIEKEPLLGGHAQTYIAPNGYAVDYGVVVFEKTQQVYDYFGRFNIPLLNVTQPPSQNTYFDFSTGTTVTVPPTNVTALVTALQTYAEQLYKYPSLQQGFNITYPVAPDLLLTFGEFVEKYNLQALVPVVYLNLQGYGHILDVPMLYMFKALNANAIGGFTQGYVTTKNHDIYALYAAAGAYLNSSNVLTSSYPLAIDRSGSKVSMLVATPKGRKLIIAKKLVTTIPPTLNKLSAYDLTAQEKSLFKQWNVNGFYTGILNGTNFPSNLSLIGAQAGQPYELPSDLGVYTMQVNVPAGNLVQVYYGSTNVQSNAVVKANIEAAVQKVQKAHGLPVQTPDWAVFSSHSPFALEVGIKAIAAGFYKQLLALQGTQNSFWNGAAWMAQDSTSLWKFTEETVLPGILAAF